MSELLVSVLIASYNHEAYIREAVESIWSQSYPNIELIVVDDHSTDESLAILKFLERLSPIPMRVFSNEVNAGPSFTLAKALELSRGELISFLASDDIFAPTRFEKQVQLFEENARMALIFANGCNLQRDGQTGSNVHGSSVKSLLQRPAADVLEHLYTNVGPLFIQAALVRRDVIDGSIDKTALADDWVINIKMFEKIVATGAQHYFVDQIVFHYRQHVGNVSKNIDRHVAVKEQVIERYIPSERLREAKANIYWNIGDSLIVARPLTALKYLYLSQKSVVRPLRIISLVRRILLLAAMRIQQAARG